MRIGNFQIGFAPKKQKEQQPPTDEIAYSQSMLYGLLSGFEEYNPDDLVSLKSLKIYKKMAQDEQIKVVARFRRNAVTGRGWVFQFDNDVDLSDEEKERRITVFNEAINQMSGSFRRKLNSVMSSMRYGYSLTEKTFKPINVNGQTYWGVKNLRTKPAETFYFKTDEFGELEKLIQKIDGKNQEFDIGRFIHHVHNPEEHEYYGQSELREAYRSWWSKDVIIRLWNIYIERMAGGLIWAQPTQGESGVQRGTDQKNKLMQVLANIQTKTGILMPGGYDLNVEHPTSTDAFEKAVNNHDLGIAKALLMPDKLGFSSTGDNGSRALGQTQLEAFLWLLDAEAADLAETLNEQLFEELGHYNFGDGIYPLFTFKPLSQSMINTIATIWKDLVTAGAVEATDTDEDHLRDLLRFPEKGEPIKKTSPQQPGSPLPGITNEDDPDDNGDTPPPNKKKDKGQEIGETIVGRGLGVIEYDKKVFTRAMRRVDFAKIDMSTNVALYQGINKLNSGMESLLTWATDKIKNGIMTDPVEVAELKAPASVLRNLRKSSEEILTNGWEIGISNGKQELEKAGIKQMSTEKFKRFTALGEMAANYFKAKSFTMAGRLTEDALNTIKNEIQQGIKYDKTVDEVIEEIYIAFAAGGFLDRVTLEVLLGDALGVDNPQHRLETTVRTSMFEAVNEARFNYFTSADVGGFVTALEYSAILDGQTTSICQELDGKVYLARAPEWDQYRPPNHFNCRSLLVPVTTRDEVAITEGQPGIQPQSGFS